MLYIITASYTSKIITFHNSDILNHIDLAGLCDGYFDILAGFGDLDIWDQRIEDHFLGRTDRGCCEILDRICCHICLVCFAEYQFCAKDKI